MRNTWPSGVHSASWLLLRLLVSSAVTLLHHLPLRLLEGINPSRCAHLRSHACDIICLTAGCSLDLCTTIHHVGSAQWRILVTCTFVRDGGGGVDPCAANTCDRKMKCRHWKLSHETQQGLS